MTTRTGLEQPPLPAYLTRFVGRRLELHDLRERLVTRPRGASLRGSGHSGRLLTLCGVGGSGKTRLALELAVELSRADEAGAAGFDHGVRWVSLAPVTDGSQLPRAVAAGWGSSLSRSAEPTRSVILSVRDHSTLLVLDNCEHVLEPCRALAEQLLDACPGLVIVTTTREPLGLAYETVVPVPPLSSSAGEPGAGSPGGPSEATQLFLDRAALVAPTYTLSPSTAEVIAAICQRLDGLPLAIELAASWVRVLTVHDLLAEIDRNISILSAALPGIEERHRSVRAVLESSWLRLSAMDQQVLSSLSVFTGDFSRAAAEVAGGATLASLSTLVEKSLIQRRPDSDSETRYHMHELVREHALARLSAEPERLQQARRDHLDYFLALVEQTQDVWDTEGEDTWLGRLRRDEPNVNAALGWALDQRYAEDALRLSAGLFAFWIYTSAPGTYQLPLERALALPWDAASVTTKRARARTLNVAGYATAGHGDPDRACGLFEEGMCLFGDLGDDSAVAWSLRGRGFALRLAGDVEGAQADAERSLAMCRTIGDLPGEAWSVHDLGEIAVARGDLTTAQTQLGQAFALFGQRGIAFGAYRAVAMLGEVQLRLGEWLLALAHYDDALVRQRRAHFVTRGADILEGLAEVAFALHRPEQAARLLGAGDSWRRTFGIVRDFVRSDGYARSTAAVIRQLKESAWSASYAAGAELTPAQATDEAVLHVLELSAVARAQRAGITGREREVLRALALGLSNAQIAAQLVVSQRTVHAHVRSIFGKLEVSSRTAAARRAAQLNLV
ncbi:MAG TPA: LuxR C-terminal-related transcriptional regulator [Propionibacteriaceae bacterium]